METKDNKKLKHKNKMNFTAFSGCVCVNKSFKNKHCFTALKHLNARLKDKKKEQFKSLTLGN